MIEWSENKEILSKVVDFALNGKSILKYLKFKNKNNGFRQLGTTLFDVT